MVNHPEADRKELHRQHQALKVTWMRRTWSLSVSGQLIFTWNHLLKARFSAEMGSEFIPKLSQSPKFTNLAGCVTFQED